MLMNLKNFTLRSERLLVIALLACSTPHAFAISMVSEDSHNPVVNQQDTQSRELLSILGQENLSSELTLW